MKQSMLGMFAVGALTAWAQQQPAVEAKLVNEGVQLDGGSMGNFNLTYPLLNFGGDDIRSKPVEVRVNGNKAELKYKNNGVVSVSLENDKFKYSFTSVPGGLKSTSHQMFVPFNYNQGGAWSTDGQSGAFPAQKPAEGKIFMGHSRSLSISDVNHSKLSLGLPPNTYIEVRDNREWNWNIFSASFSTPFNPDMKTVEIKFGRDNSEFRQAKLLDKFGEISCSRSKMTVDR